MIDDVRQILLTLRDVRLDWMADEVEMTIRAGKTVLKDVEPGVARQLKNPTVTMPFSADEELAICLRTIRAYFVDLPAVWSKTETLLKGIFEGNAINHLEEIKIVDAEERQMMPFDQSYSPECLRLETLLQKAGF